MSGVWNETAPNGGDSITDAAYMNGQYTPGDFAWILFASALVWLMIPGIGYVPSLLTNKVFSMEGWVVARALWLLFGRV